MIIQGETRETFGTPQQLAAAIRQRPRTVRFDGEAVIGSTWSGRVADLPAGMTIVIWGPYRLWRVRVSRGRHGFHIEEGGSS